MHPSRRRLLRSCGSAIAAVAVAGCLSLSDRSSTPTNRTPSATTPTAEATRTATATPSPDRAATDTPRDAERIMVALDNGRAAAVMTTVTVTGEAGPVVETGRTVPAEEYVTVFSGVREPGEYEFRVELDDGSSAARTFDIESYDVEAGSNVVAWIRKDGVELVIEE